MATKNVQGAAAEVDRLQGEVENLTGQLASARQSARDAEHEIGAISARRRELGLAVFREDPAAVEELAELRSRAASAEETLEVSAGASEQLERRLGETKEALAEARIRVHREKADELYRQSAELDPKRDELARQLFEVLEEQARIDSDRMQEVRWFDQDEANRRAVAGDGVAEWLRGAFARWLW